MTLADIAAWHRAREAGCERAEAFARAGYRAGCEDAELDAAGWRARAKEHAGMAATIESFISTRGMT
jgi:hypothetical protein